jgi:hypothetical protein
VEFIFPFLYPYLSVANKSLLHYIECDIEYVWLLADQLYYVMQVIEVIRHPRDKAESKYNPDVGMTKEDEERYQKLVAENEELQKLISAVRLFKFYVVRLKRRVLAVVTRLIEPLIPNRQPHLPVAYGIPCFN